MQKKKKIRGVSGLALTLRAKILPEKNTASRVQNRVPGTLS